MRITKVGDKVSRVLRRLLRNDRGNTALVLAVVMPLLIGAGGLAVDTIQWVSTKSRLQQAADAAAIAGSLSTVQGGSADWDVDQALSGYRPDLASLTTSVSLSPPGHDGDPNAVAVKLTASSKLYFASMFMSSPPTITANATATVVETPDFCVLALMSQSDAGMMLKPGSVVESECGFATNATGGATIEGDSSAKMSVAKLFSAGLIPAGTNNGARTKPYALKQKDPLADVNAPKVPNTGCPNITVNGDGLKDGRTLSPGCYGNIILDGQVRLEPGEYILNRGSLFLGSTAYVTCEGCTFFFTSENAEQEPGSIGSVRMDSNAVVKFSAPSQGPHKDILMFQDRRSSGGENLIAGNARSKIDGILYFPNQDLVIAGRASSSLECARIIGSRLMFDGQLYIAGGCDADSGKYALKGAEVRLVE